MGILRASGLNIQSSGYIPAWTVNDVTASRAIDGTTYTNTTGKTMHVNVTVEMYVAAIGAIVSAFIYVDGNIKNSTGILIGGTGVIDIKGNLSAIVPPGSTYKITNATAGLNSTIALSYWSEAY